MKTMKWLAMGMAAAVAAGGFTEMHARAQDAGARPGGPGVFLARVKERLDLTDDQMARIKTELGRDRTTLTALLSALHDTRTALRGVIQKPGATEAEIRAASAKVAAVEADVAVERARLFGRISPILTPEQLAKARELQDRVDTFVDGAIQSVGEMLTQ